MSALESITQELPVSSQVSFDVYPLKSTRGHLRSASALYLSVSKLDEETRAEFGGSTEEQVKQTNTLGSVVLKSLFINARPETVANPSLKILVASFPESDDLKEILFTERRFKKRGALIIKCCVIIERSKDSLGYVEEVGSHEIDELGMISHAIVEAYSRPLSYVQEDKPRVKDEVTASLKAARNSVDGNINSSGKLITAKRLAKPLNRE